MDFISPTLGSLTVEEVFKQLFEYMEYEGGHKYNIIIGTDSYLSKQTVFVTAIIVHRMGHGGRYFYTKCRRRKIKSVRQRMFYEATMSIEMASVVKEKLSQNGFKKLPVEIHLDVGVKGDTRDIVKEVVGMVTGSGYAAVIKPDSYGATKVADRHSR